MCTLGSQRGFQDREASGVPTRAVEPLDEAAGDGIAHIHKDDRTVRVPRWTAAVAAHDDVGLQADQLLRELVSDYGAPNPPHVVREALTSRRYRNRLHAN